MPIDYQAWYDNAQAELLRVREEKAALDQSIVEREQQIAALLQTMRAIAPLVGKEPPDLPPSENEPLPVGMTDAIRTTLSKASEPLAAGEIRDRLDTMGFDMKSYSNALATVHTVLRRLTEAEEAEVHEGDGGKKYAIAESPGYTIGLALEKTSGRFGARVVKGKSFALGKELKGYLGVSKGKKK